jgi:hypothetical protein
LDTTLPEKGNPKLMEGTFKWFDNKALLIVEETYKNGHPFFFKSCYWDKLDPSIIAYSEVLYFDRRFNNIPGTLYFEELGRNGKLLGSYWYRKGKKRWRSYRIKK